MDLNKASKTKKFFAFIYLTCKMSFSICAILLIENMWTSGTGLDLGIFNEVIFTLGIAYMVWWVFLP